MDERLAPIVDWARKILDPKNWVARTDFAPGEKEHGRQQQDEEADKLKRAVDGLDT